MWLTTLGVVQPPTVLVVDYGAQYAQLIARRVREAQVYSEIVPGDTPVEEILAREPAAIVLSGGPSSVYEPGAPAVDPKLFTSGVPVLGLCYGFQAMARALGGEVAPDGTRLPYDVLERISTRITNEVAEVNRVVLDVTSKPPGTIEWE